MVFFAGRAGREPGLVGDRLWSECNPCQPRSGPFPGSVDGRCFPVHGMVPGAGTARNRAAARSQVKPFRLLALDDMNCPVLAGVVFIRVDRRVGYDRNVVGSIARLFCLPF